MDYQEKIRRLLDSRSKTSLSKSAGLPASTLDSILNKNQEPRAQKAVKIAQALDVSADWLFDNSKDWPPPDAGDTIATASDDELLRIVTARFEGAVRRVASLNRIPDADLAKAEQLASAPETANDPFVGRILWRITDELMIGVRLVTHIKSLQSILDSWVHIDVTKYPNLREQAVLIRGLYSGETRPSS